MQCVKAGFCAGFLNFFKNARRYGIKKSRPAGSPGQPQVADQQPQVGRLPLAQSGHIQQGPVVPPQQDRMSGGGGDPGGSALPAGADAAWQLNPTKKPASRAACRWGAE